MTKITVDLATDATLWFRETNNIAWMQMSRTKFLRYVSVYVYVNSCIYMYIYSDIHILLIYEHT